jgi:hypothetical protein
MGHPITDVRDISRIAYGFMASKALFCALSLDLFLRLSAQPHSVASLAAALGVAANRLEPLLSTLDELGLVAREDGAYRNAPASEQYLVSGAAADFSDYYRFQIDRLIYPRLSNLRDCFGAEERLDNFYAGPMEDALTAEEFIRGQHAGSKGPAYLLAKTVDLGKRRHLLDVGGGSGAVSHALCKRFPQLRATILEIPSVIPLAERYTREAGLQGRIAFVAGDALGTAWPAPVDAVLLSYLLSSIAGDAVPGVLAKAAAALEPGGVLIVHDFIHAERDNSPSLTPLWALTAMALNPETAMLTEARMRSLLAEPGFADITQQPLVSGITAVITCRKP